MHCRIWEAPGCQPNGVPVLQDDVALQQQWAVNGLHYSRTTGGLACTPGQAARRHPAHHEAWGGTSVMFHISYAVTNQGHTRHLQKPVKCHLDRTVESGVLHQQCLRGRRVMVSFQLGVSGGLET